MDIDGDNVISFDYDSQYQMLTYDIPVGKDWRAMGHLCENFQYAVEIMSKHIEEHALSAINKAADFKYVCAEYD